MTGFSKKRLKYLSLEPLRYGANAPADFDDRDWPRFVRITDIDGNGQLRDDTFRSLPSEIADHYLLEEGDILLARSGATVGKSFIYSPSWGKACFAGYLIRFRTSDCHAARFVYWFFQSNEYWSEVSSNLIQSTIQNFSAERYANIAVPCPSLNTQKRIAIFLDAKTAQIDALIAKKQALLERLAEKRQAIITQAVTKGLDASAPMKESGIDWLDQIPAHWEVVTLNKVTTKITNGYVGPTRDLFVNDGVRYIQSLHIKGNRIIFLNDFFVKRSWSDQHSNSILKIGDVLIVQTGGIGQVAVVTPEYEGCNCHALIICEPLKDRLQGNYLSWLFNSDYGQEFLQMVKTGALHPHLNCGNVKFFTVLIPPLNEQTKIVSHIARECKQIARINSMVEDSLDRLREYRSALITAAVTGQIADIQ